MVVHDPGPWFDEVLAALAVQDYANLKLLLLVAGEPGDVPDRIRAVLPDAFVRAVAGNPGFGPAANEVIELVQGDNGYFCFLHDDVALDADAIRLLVEELYRSNAGIVGPKLVDWDRPRVLQHVGYDVDRFGEVDPLVEAGEVDQEQHDAIRDVFALPSACLLVRADLFRSLGGFDETISYHGEDVDLCWRAHLSGARVVVVPTARGRHLEQLTERRPDLPHETLRARHRMRALATLSGARRLPLLSLQVFVLTVVEAVVGVFTGRARAGWAGLRGMVGLIPRTPALLARRRVVAPGRLVPDREVVGLQMRGSARLAAFLRARDARPDVQRIEQRGWRERAGASTVIAWLVLVLAVVIGSRAFITDGVPEIGQFLPFGESPREMWRAFSSEWWDHGLGARTAAPTAMGLTAVASVGTLFRMGLLHTLGVVGLLVLGPLGLWRLTRAYSTNRSRIVALLVYAAVPLPGQMISIGRWGALVCYAALPWTIDGLRRFAGLEPGATAAAGERAVPVALRRRVMVAASTVLVSAIAIAFEPTYSLLVLAVAVVLAGATLLTDVRPLAAAQILLLGVIATVGGCLLNLPWIATYIGDGGWSAFVGPPTYGPRGNSVVELMSFDLGNAQGALLALALYVPVLAAVLLGRGWRFAWGARAGFLVVVFGWLAALDDGGSLPLRLPEPGIVLAPVVVGVALAAGASVAAFELDVRGGKFGWRQPLALLSAIAIGVGILPGVFSVTSGSWNAPSTTMLDLLGQFPEQPADGDYRILWIGDQRVVPAAGQSYSPGITYALTENRSLEVDDVFATRPTDTDEVVTEALEAIATGSTARAGRLLAPFSVRYIVIPIVDGAVSTSSNPLPVPAGLLDALGDQLDLGEVFSPPNFVVFENKAWIPVRSMLTPEGAAASEVAGAAALAQADVSGAVPVMLGASSVEAGSEAISPGTLYLGVPFDRGWTVEVDGSPIEGRPAFGSTMAWDVPTTGTAVLEYQQGSTRRLFILIQVIAWVLVALVASGARFRASERRRSAPRAEVPAEPLLSFGPGVAPVDPGLTVPEVPGVPEVPDLPGVPEASAPGDGHEEDVE
jgi:GT2 family glycosyltransferase